MEQSLMPSDEYFAGFFDGEGHVSTRRDRWSVAVGVTNTNKDVIELFTIRFGGKIQHRKRNKVRKDCWSWRVRSKAEMKAFLSAIYPYLRVKRVQAQIGLQIIDMIGECGNNKTTNIDAPRRRILVNHLTELNKRGM